MSKTGLVGKAGQAKQQQMIQQMRKNPNLIQQRINQMDPRQLQAMGGRDNVLAMMQQMAKGGSSGGPSSMDMMGGGMPDLGAMMGQQGGLPNGMPALPPGMNMESLMQMAQAMGLGGGPPQMPQGFSPSGTHVRR
jgi:hypothetical protein